MLSYEAILIQKHFYTHTQTHTHAHTHTHRPREGEGDERPPLSATWRTCDGGQRPGTGSILMEMVGRIDGAGDQRHVLYTTHCDGMMKMHM